MCFKFNEKIMLFHSVDMTETIPQNFLTLSISMKVLDESEDVAKYPKRLLEKLWHQKIG